MKPEALERNKPLKRARRAAICFVAGMLCFVAATSALAQRVGDTTDKVQQALGTPSMQRETGDRQVWIYPEGVRIVFEAGKVVESNAPGVAAAPDVQDNSVATEKAEPEEAPKFVPRKVPQARARPSKSVAVVETVTLTKELKDTSGFGFFLVVAGVIISAIAGIIILVEAFSQSVLWGIALLVFPITQLIFVGLHWQQTKKPFLSAMFIGLPLMVAGSFL